MIPNQDQIQSLVRQVLIFASAYAVGSGWLTNEQALQVITYIVPLGMVVWGLFVHRKAATVARAADIVPIPAAVQAGAGVASPVLVPTRPKQ